MLQSKVRMIWITPDAEKQIAYCARVSNPNNQNNENIEKLLKYCMRNGHWSVFEMASMCLEITASRVIIDQILRHRSFSFQVFSTRYAEVEEFVPTTPRRQDDKNRQSSHDDLSDDVKLWFTEQQRKLWTDARNVYDKALDLGIAKENARDLLPMSQRSRMYMNGTIRSWIHYLDLRTHVDTQKEHRDIAMAIKEQIFSVYLPTIAKALWENEGTK